MTAALLVAGAVTVNVAFIGLGSVFDYPDVLSRPAAESLALFRAHQPAVVGWFTLLAAGAALLAPIAIRIGRRSGHRAMRIADPVGIAAAAVQVIGLLRWPLVVPALAERAADPDTAAAAEAQYTLLGAVLGTAIGETAGYLLTAVWTLLVAVALGELGRVVRGVGLLAALLIASGVLVPLDVPGAEQANFLGYVVWSMWLVAVAVRLVRA